MDDGPLTLLIAAGGDRPVGLVCIFFFFLHNTELFLHFSKLHHPARISLVKPI